MGEGTSCVLSVCCFCLRPRLRRFARASSLCPRRSSTASRLSYLQTHAPSPTSSQQLKSHVLPILAPQFWRAVCGSTGRAGKSRRTGFSAAAACMHSAAIICGGRYRAITTLNCNLMIALTPISVPDHKSKRLSFTTHCLLQVFFTWHMLIN